MRINEKKFTNRSLPVRQIEGAASDVFHEGRHAEQRFSVARYMARDGMSADKIAGGAEIELKAAEHAVRVERAHPRSPNSAEAKDAQAFYSDTVEHHEEHKSIEKLAPAISAVGTEAKAILDALPPHEQAAVRGRWEEYRARMYQVIDAYQRLPTERDAYAAEKKLGLQKK
jgi:hypothetical protein